MAERKRKKKSKSFLEDDFPVDSSEEESVSSDFDEEDAETVLDDSENLENNETESIDEKPSWGRGAQNKRKKAAVSKGGGRSRLALDNESKLSQLVNKKNASEVEESLFTASPALLPIPARNCVPESDSVGHTSVFSPFLPPQFIGASRACFSERRSASSTNSTQLEYEMHEFLGLIQSRFVPITPTFRWDDALESIRL